MIKSNTGIVRLWLVLSIIWMGVIIWRSDLSCLFKETIGVNAPWCQFALVDPQAYYAALALRIFGAPLVAAVAIFAILWVIAGFKRRRRDRL